MEWRGGAVGERERDEVRAHRVGNMWPRGTLGDFGFCSELSGKHFFE